jgi:hypothetical protein
MVENTYLGFDMLLGRSWFNKHNVTIAPAKNSIYIHSERTRIRLRSKEGELPPTPTVHEISGRRVVLLESETPARGPKKAPPRSVLLA